MNSIDALAPVRVTDRHAGQLRVVSRRIDRSATPGISIIEGIMRLSLQGVFDLGRSVGFGDAVLLGSVEEQLPKFEALEGATVKRHRGLPEDLTLLLGHGIELDITNSKLFKEWAAAASHISWLDDPWSDNDLRSPRPSSPSRRAMQEAFDKSASGAGATLVLYAMGMAFIRVDLSAVDASSLRPVGGTMPVNDLRACWENALGRKGFIALDATGAQLARVMGEAKESVKRFVALSSRPPARQLLDQFSGFTSIAICEQSDNVDDVISTFTKIEGRELAKVRVEDDAFHVGWVSCVLASEKGTADSLSCRALVLLEIAFVSLAVCQAFERLFSHRVIATVEEELDPTRTLSAGDAEDLKDLRLLGLAVINVTTYRDVTMSVDDFRFFDAFETMASLARRHRRIAEECSVLDTVLRAKADDRKRSARYKDDRRARAFDSRIQLAVNVLASFAMLSVVADTLNVIDYPTTGMAIGITLAKRVFLLSLIIIVISMLWILHWRAVRRSKTSLVDG